MERFHKFIKSGRMEKKPVRIAQMKHLKHSKRAAPTHPSAFAIPAYHPILVRHGLIEKTLSIPDAYEVFFKVGAEATSPTPKETFLYVNVAVSLPRSFSACALVVKSRDRKINSPLRRSYTTHRSFVRFPHFRRLIPYPTRLLASPVY